MTLFIISKGGTVHGGRTPCVHALKAERTKPVTLAQIVLYKLPHCDHCWTHPRDWTALLHAPTSVGAR